ncbi:MAG TPA: hypothetical protein VG265_14870 [Gaiellaceae bacterium]|nr:hypothetical protein [Gaiellaceae bacterium]
MRGDGPRPTERELTGDISFTALLREDWEAHGRSFASPGLHGLALHRIAVARRSLPPPFRHVLGAVTRTVNKLLIRNLYGLELHESTVIGRRVTIGHHVGVVLGAHAVIEDDCIIRQNVTLGVVDNNTEHQPWLRRHVLLGAGCSVLGHVTIGPDAIIGPGAVVITDVPAGATAFAPPARIMKAGAGPASTPSASKG